MMDGIPDAIVERLRAVVLDLDAVAEEAAWTGVRWRTRGNTFAHLVLITDGWPPAYAAAAEDAGPLCVLTLRCDHADVDMLVAADSTTYFAPAWGSTWTPSLLGVRLDDQVDWDDIVELVANSHRTVGQERTSRRNDTRARLSTRPSSNPRKDTA